MAYEFNSKAYYAPYGKHREKTTNEELCDAVIVVRDNGKSHDFFKLKLRDDFLNLSTYQYLHAGDPYTPEGENFHTSRATENFQHAPMALWEVQLNFAVHCATSALGVSTEHLNAGQPLVRSLYRFHIYYHVRRVLKRMESPLPSDQGFDKYNNSYSLSKVHRLGDEYGASTKNLHIYEIRCILREPAHHERAMRTSTITGLVG